MGEDEMNLDEEDEMDVGEEDEIDLGEEDEMDLNSSMLGCGLLCTGKQRRHSGNDC